MDILVFRSKMISSKPQKQYTNSLTYGQSSNNTSSSSLPYRFRSNNQLIDLYLMMVVVLMAMTMVMVMVIEFDQLIDRIQIYFVLSGNSVLKI